MVEVDGASIKSEGDENIWEPVSTKWRSRVIVTVIVLPRINWEYISAILCNSDNYGLRCVLPGLQFHR